MSGGDKKDWDAPLELAGTLKVKPSHTDEKLKDMESLAQSLGWKVTPRGECPDCDRIKRSGG